MPDKRSSGRGREPERPVEIRMTRSRSMSALRASSPAPAPEVTKRKRRGRCDQCFPCMLDPCDKCKFCQDKSKRQTCEKRQCLNPLLPACVVCQFCHKTNAQLGLGRDDANSIHECAGCFGYSHPGCAKEKYPDKEGRILNMMATLWLCPACVEQKVKAKPCKSRLKKMEESNRLLQNGSLPPVSKDMMPSQEDTADETDTATRTPPRKGQARAAPGQGKRGTRAPRMPSQEDTADERDTATRTPPTKGQARAAPGQERAPRTTKNRNAGRRATSSPPSVAVPSSGVTIAELFAQVGRPPATTIGRPPAPAIGPPPASTAGFPPTSTVRTPPAAPVGSLPAPNVSPPPAPIFRFRAPATVPDPETAALFAKFRFVPSHAFNPVPFVSWPRPIIDTCAPSTDATNAYAPSTDATNAYAPSTDVTNACPLSPDAVIVPPPTRPVSSRRVTPTASPSANAADTLIRNYYARQKNGGLGQCQEKPQPRFSFQPDPRHKENGGNGKCPQEKEKKPPIVENPTPLETVFESGRGRTFSTAACHRRIDFPPMPTHGDAELDEDLKKWIRDFEKTRDNDDNPS